jgi:hypothetical protein
VAKSRETKADGDKLFVNGNYAKAIEAYSSAASLLPEGAAERADLLSCKAACLYAQRRWRDSARECTATLAAPGASAAAGPGARALIRRAHCYEHLGLFKQGLSDAQAFNRTDLATEESRRLEQRLRAALQGGGGGASAAGSASAVGAGVNRGGPAGRAAAAAAAYQQQQQQQQSPPRGPPQPQYFAAKLTLPAVGADDAAASANKAEARVVHMPANAASYAMLRREAAAKFASELAPNGLDKPFAPFVLKYADRAGAAVTITCRDDVATAAAAAVARDDEALRRLQASGMAAVLPPFDVTIVRVKDEGEVPPVPAEEEQQHELFVKQLRVATMKLQQAQQAHRARLEAEEAEVAAAAALLETQQGGGQLQQQQQDALLNGGQPLIDDWLLEFAEIFRDMSQLDSDAHTDALNEGYDATTKAMAATLRCDAALPLFQRAQDKFAEVTALGLVNWGNVHVNIAHKHGDDASLAAAEAARAAGVGDSNEARAKAAKPLLASAAKKSSAEFDAAEKRYQEALKYRPDFFEALAAMGALELERAKLRAGLVQVPADLFGAEGSGKKEPGEEGEAGAKKEAEDAAKTGGAAEVTPAAAASLREALRRVTPGDVSSAKKHYDAALKWFEKARLSGAAADSKRVAEASAAASRAGASEGGSNAAAAAQAEAQQLAPELSSESQALIMSGNAAYEWSQLLGAVAGDEAAGKAGDKAVAWRAVLDDAAARYRDAKCPEGDVRAALKNHTRAADLDLGPDPEPEEEEEEQKPTTGGGGGGHKAAAAAGDGGGAAEAAAAPKPAAKGLPSLDVKGKKKGGEAAAKA